jgi:hypothetical protein
MNDRALTAVEVGLVLIALFYFVLLLINGHYELGWFT